MVNAFDDLVQNANENIHEQRDRGTWFERMVVAYLKNEPLQKATYSDVWMLSDVPDEYGISKQDKGIDIVAKDAVTGELTAVQAKFKKDKIEKSTIDSFLNQSQLAVFSKGLIVSTVDNWSKNAEEALDGLRNPVTRIGLSELRNSEIDWTKYKFESPETVELKKKKTLRPHQQGALDAVLKGLEDADRGQLIMAPGTGKTFTSLKITEALAKKSGNKPFNVLYLVPSIQLLSQTLKAWNSDTEMLMHSFAVTSDRKATKVKKDESNADISARDLGYPATTDPMKLVDNYKQALSQSPQRDLMVVFSTYQSIDVIGRAQDFDLPEFDLIIADEAHRTTGSHLMNDDESVFTKVHSNENVRGKKRLYQTATPKIYGPAAKQKADENSIVLAAMDDVTLYGEKFYTYSFGDAITDRVLTDYKVVVLGVDEAAVSRTMQSVMKDAETGELKLDDVTKIIGVWNGMVKRQSFTDAVDGLPMRRAISFIDTIDHSKNIIAPMFERVVNQYLGGDGVADSMYRVKVKHVDGSMNALQKNDALDWLKSDIPDDKNEARILSNVRFLTEGIDVPNLDAVIFMSPKKSQVDIVQAVGRIMRKFDTKEYGYILLPVGIPADTTPENVLNDNKAYKQIWQVLNALRSMDGRFDAMINKIDLNKNKPKNVQLIGVGGAPEDERPFGGEGVVPKPADEQLSLNLETFEEVENAIYGKIVQKVGDRRYWEQWSGDVAKIARQHMTRIRVMIEDENSEPAIAFEKFLKEIRYELNSGITKDSAIEMLAQHMITKPVFDALFESYSFIKTNPVSQVMEDIIQVLERNKFEEEQESLDGFYASVAQRAKGIDNAEGKQTVIKELYEKFFQTAFKDTTDRLGIVFTPVEIVDFIVKSVDQVLDRHFGKGLSDEGVHILDPFTGTGTFVTRTLQYLEQQMNEGKISFTDVLRKYTQELHANEIVLLSYYIAAINIEAVFDDISGDDRGYEQFPGIVLTDTFDTTEHKDDFLTDMLGENNARLKSQQENPIFAIIGNPPYSIGQENVNEDNANIEYPKLEESIANTYAKYTDSDLKKGLYDTYIKAFRWATDRIGSQGVIGFVTNGSFIDTKSTAGFRKVLNDEFNYLYIFNLRGNQRTGGEMSRREGGKVFDSGSRAPIAISILVKDGSDNHVIKYHDIGDYLSRLEKLDIIKNFAGVDDIDWVTITPDENNDWINLRDANYQNYPSLFSKTETSLYESQYTGIYTARDNWVSNFSKKQVNKNVTTLIDNYNSEIDRLTNVLDANDRMTQKNNNDSFVSWSTGLNSKFKKGQRLSPETGKYIQWMYRPFVKKWLYWDDFLNERPSSYRGLSDIMGTVLYMQGSGANKDFSVLATNLVPSLQLVQNGKGFPQNVGKDAMGMLSNLNEVTLEQIGMDSEEDAIAYVYALLHHPDFLQKYASDLKKDYPRIPKVEQQVQFIEIGKKLLGLHLQYEDVPLNSDVEIVLKKDNPSYSVISMKPQKTTGMDTIHFNADIDIRNIPDVAWEYVVNGKPAIQWIIEQYQVGTDSATGIVDDPNQYSDDEKYVFNLLLRIIELAKQTQELVKSLPALRILN